MSTVHVFPLSLEVDDLEYRDVGRPGYFTRDEPLDDCALCKAGRCTQRVERHPRGGTVIVHSLRLDS